MKKIILGTLMIAVALFSCKTTKKTAKTVPNAQTSTTAPTKVFSVPQTNESKSQTITEKPITSRKEQITFTQQEDKTANESNSYFVIIGSFSQLENAKNFRTTLISEGFTPIIVHSETGYYRVCVNSYKNETSARERIAQIRTNYPKYADTWLLITQ
jgi:cell division protein FtsN